VWFHKTHSPHLDNLEILRERRLRFSSKTTKWFYKLVSPGTANPLITKIQVIKTTCSSGTHGSDYGAVGDYEIHTCGHRGPKVSEPSETASANSQVPTL
jgi:hypothetical protein